MVVLQKEVVRGKIPVKGQLETQADHLKPSHIADFLMPPDFVGKAKGYDKSPENGGF
jgi:hypothetical protein